MSLVAGSDNEHFGLAACAVISVYSKFREEMWSGQEPGPQESGLMLVDSLPNKGKARSSLNQPIQCSCLVFMTNSYLNSWRWHRELEQLATSIFSLFDAVYMQ